MQTLATQTLLKCDFRHDKQCSRSNLDTTKHAPVPLPSTAVLTTDITQRFVESILSSTVKILIYCFYYIFNPNDFCNCSKLGRKILPEDAADTSKHVVGPTFYHIYIYRAFVVSDNKLIKYNSHWLENINSFFTFCQFQTNVASFIPTGKHCALPCSALHCHAMTCPVMPRPALPCLALPCPTLPYTSNYRKLLVRHYYYYYYVFIVISNVPEYVSPIQTDRS